MYCSECGKEISDDSEFCGFCAAPVRAAAAAAEKPPSDSYPPSAAKASVPGDHATSGQAPPPKRSPLPWVLGGVALAVIIALALVLIFVVFKGDNKTGASSDASAAEEVLKTFYEALEKQDADMLVGTFEPSFREELEEVIGKEYKRFLEDWFFPALPEDFKMNMGELDTKIEGDKATVTMTGGSITYTDEKGDQVTEEASEGETADIFLVRVDGQWYLSSDYLKASGFDPKALKSLQGAGLDLDLETGADGGTGAEGGTDAGEIAEVEKAMQAFIEEKAEDGLEFAITGLMIHGDEAIGIAVCTNRVLDNEPVAMKKGSSGWYGTGFGEDVDLPTWFEDEMEEAQEAGEDYIEGYVGPGWELRGLLIRGDEAVGVVVSEEQPDKAPVIMKKGPKGWEGVDFGTGVAVPSWYKPNYEAWFK